VSATSLWQAVAALELLALEAARAAAPDPLTVDAHLTATEERRRVLHVELIRIGSRRFLTVTTTPWGLHADTEIFHILDLEERRQ
jgi:hypothetical protein